MFGGTEKYPNRQTSTIRLAPRLSKTITVNIFRHLNEAMTHGYEYGKAAATALHPENMSKSIKYFGARFRCDICVSD